MKIKNIVGIIIAQIPTIVLAAAAPRFSTDFLDYVISKARTSFEFKKESSSSRALALSNFMEQRAKQKNLEEGLQVLWNKGAKFYTSEHYRLLSQEMAQKNKELESANDQAQKEIEELKKQLAQIKLAIEFTPLAPGGPKPVVLYPALKK